MKRVCVYPGSFDPVTVGHMDIIARAAQLFDEVVVVVMRNPHKQGCFPVDERLSMLRKCCAELKGVRVAAGDGLTVAFAKSVGACAMIRGLRDASDFAAEQQLAQVNAAITPEIETVFLMCQPAHSMVSSSNVREMASFGCDISRFVPEQVRQEIEERFTK